jgi:hypothetical protein
VDDRLTIGWIGDQVVLLPVLELVPDVEAVPDPLLEPGAAPPGAPPMPPVLAIRSFSVVPPEVVVEPKTLSPTLNDERETVEPLRCRCVDDVTV